MSFCYVQLVQIEAILIDGVHDSFSSSLIVADAFGVIDKCCAILVDGFCHAIIDPSAVNSNKGINNLIPPVFKQGNEFIVFPNIGLDEIVQQCIIIICRLFF